MTNFKLDKDRAVIGRKVWTKGDDTCGNPLLEIHAPYDRVAAAEAYLLYFVDPSLRQTQSMLCRAKWLRFKSYRKAQQYAKGLNL